MPLLTTQSAKSYGFLNFISAAGDFVRIDGYTLTSSASTINFNIIPQTYSSLWIVGNVISTSAAPNFNWNYNGITTSTYNYLYMENATAGNNVSTTYALGGTVGANGASVIVKIPDYTKSKYKSAVIQTATETYVSTIGNVWQSNNAITSISCFLAGNTFAAGSSLTLYGLK